MIVLITLIKPLTWDSFRIWLLFENNCSLVLTSSCGYVIPLAIILESEEARMNLTKFAAFLDSEGDSKTFSLLSLSILNIFLKFSYKGNWIATWHNPKYEGSRPL